MSIWLVALVRPRSFDRSFWVPQQPCWTAPATFGSCKKEFLWKQHLYGSRKKLYY